MLNLFGLNAFARKRKAQATRAGHVPAIEALEDRIVLASQVTSILSNGSLILSGSGDNDDLVVTITGTNVVTLTTNGATTFVGAGAGPFVVTGSLSISLGNGADTLSFVGAAAGTLNGGNVSIDLGSGNDLIGPLTGNLAIVGDITVIGGTGDDAIQLGGPGAALEAENISVDNGSDGTESTFLDGVTASGNVTIKNNGTLAQTIDIGTLAPSSIGGNLTITQSNPANTGGYSAFVTDTPIGGNLSIANGNGTGPALVQISSAVAASVGGTTLVVNGNNANNTVNFSGATLQLTGNITVKNGTATGANAINVDGVVGSGASAASFANGSGGSNTITFGAAAANSFLGLLSLTNGNATTTNAITVDQTSVARTTNLTNGNATTTNSVTIGANVAVTFSANTVIKNGVGTVSDTIAISRLSAGAGVTPGGNVTISNAASGATSVTLGGAGANTIAGDLLITNLATTGARTVTINATAVNGRTGVAVNNTGSGTSTLNVGNTTLVTIGGKLDVQDAGGNAFANLQNLTVGSITYNDLGGGADVLNLGTAGALTVIGVTRLNTGNGSDDLNIGTVGGTAVFNDSVFVSLGSGNDDVVIGASASSPAFGSANRYQFDGGAGDDTFTANPLSLSDYEAPVLPKKLKSKIASFETLA